MKFTVLSYNIHKGFTYNNRQFILEKIRESVRAVNADALLLQEVIGEHSGHAKKVQGWPAVSQFEFLADQLWPHFAYGKNAVYTKGHHGNAILSKFPILSYENMDISQGPFEQRGLLHAQVEPKDSEKIHLICTHFGLKQKYRDFQTKALCAYINKHIPENEALIVAGDFNDWRRKISPIVWDQERLMEAYLSTHKKHARTFPSRRPLLELDRIYFRELKCTSARVVKDANWAILSDHLPLVATFQI